MTCREGCTIPAHQPESELFTPTTEARVESFEPSRIDIGTEIDETAVDVRFEPTEPDLLGRLVEVSRVKAVKENRDVSPAVEARIVLT